MVVAVSLSGVLITITNMYSEAIESQGKGRVGDLETDIEIINDPDAVPYDPVTGELTIYVKNIGSCDISQNNIVVIVNGTAYTPSTSEVSILSGATDWEPGTVAAITATIPGLAPGEDYNMKVCVNGLDSSGHRWGHADDSMEFRIL
jgi:flagellar protein FlaG